jgi:hypothetical protein
MTQYAKTGSPFDFLGHLTETQKGAFYKWLDKRAPYFTDEEKWWRIRAQQLRKTAGALENWYAYKNDEALKTRWDKQSWEPGTDGHALYSYRDDQIPSVVVGDIKELFREQLKRDDEGMFQMGHVRTLIEKSEDKAQWSHEAKATLATLRSELDSMFGRPEYQAVLVKKADEAKFRVNQMDELTEYEKKLMAGPDMKIKETA